MRAVPMRCQPRREAERSEIGAHRRLQDLGAARRRRARASSRCSRRAIRDLRRGNAVVSVSSGSSVTRLCCSGRSSQMTRPCRRVPNSRGIDPMVVRSPRQPARRHAPERGLGRARSRGGSRTSSRARSRATIRLVELLALMQQPGGPCSFGGLVEDAGRPCAYGWNIRFLPTRPLRFARPFGDVAMRSSSRSRGVPMPLQAAPRPPPAGARRLPRRSRSRRPPCRLRRR